MFSAHRAFPRTTAAKPPNQELGTDTLPFRSTGLRPAVPTVPATPVTAKAPTRSRTSCHGLDAFEAFSQLFCRIWVCLMCLHNTAHLWQDCPRWHLLGSEFAPWLAMSNWVTRLKWHPAGFSTVKVPFLPLQLIRVWRLCKYSFLIKLSIYPLIYLQQYGLMVSHCIQ